jgi:hypothetical protein
VAAKAQTPAAKSVAKAGTNGKAGAAAAAPPANRAKAAFAEKATSAWERAKAASSKQGGTTLPRGKFACRLTGAKLVNVDGGRKIIWELTCIDGESTGLIGERWSSLLESEEEKDLTWIQRDLRAFDVVDVDELGDIGSWSDEDVNQLLEAHVAQGPAVKIKCEESKDGMHMNVNILGPFAADDSGGGTAEAETPEPEEETEETEEETEEEPEEEGEEEATGELSPGDTVSYMWGKDRRSGTIEEESEDGAKWHVRDDDPNVKLRKVPKEKCEASVG